MRTAEGEKNRQLIGLFAKYVAMYELNNEQLCDTLQISERTWERRRKDLGKMPIEEFRRFVIRYNIPREELLKIL